MMVLVAYDVRTDTAAGRRRLRRVAKLCQNVGQRVQFSVFECLVDQAQWVSFRAKLIAVIKQEEDSLSGVKHSFRSTTIRFPDVV